MEMLNRVQFEYDSLDEAFPPCDPMVEPLGARILVQMRSPKNKTKGGLLLPTDVKDTEFWTVQVAKVLAVGPLAYRYPETLEHWPEGPWCVPGDFVRVPQHGGDKWTVKTDRADYEAMIVMYDCRNVLGKVADPLKLKAFI